MYITKNTKSTTIHIDLLHIVDEDNNGHFIYIKDFEKLMGSSGKHKGYYCKRCLSNLHHMKGYAVITNWVAMM